MALALRILVLFGLGLTLGFVIDRFVVPQVSVASEGSPDPDQPPLDTAHGWDRSNPGSPPERAGEGWGRVVVRASTGRGPAPGAASRSQGEPSRRPSADYAGRGRAAGTPGPPETTGSSEPQPSRATSTPARSDAAPTAQAGRLPDFELTVRPGQTLSEICYDHYGSAGPALVDALARYNGLEDANHLRASDTVRLPPRADLDQAPR